LWKQEACAVSEAQALLCGHYAIASPMSARNFLTLKWLFPDVMGRIANILLFCRVACATLKYIRQSRFEQNFVSMSP
jgi:hypothetical protein